MNSHKFRKYLIFTFLLFSAQFFSVHFSFAGGVEDGEYYYMNGNYDLALRKFRPLAEQGDVRAQYGMGVLYANGNGVPQNDVEAVRWWRISANHNNPDSQKHLGAMYAEGRGLGSRPPPIVYAQGRGLKEDYIQAYKWLTLASKNYSSTEAQKKDKALDLRRLVSTRMSKAAIEEAESLAYKWSPGDD